VDEAPLPPLDLSELRAEAARVTTVRVDTIRVEALRTEAVTRPAPPVQPVVLRGKCWVVDGDTIVIGGQNIRIAGIDAPELDHPYGNVARSALIRLVRGHEVTATVTGELSYDRLVAVCHLPDGRDIAAEMVRMGMALDWAKHSRGRYRGLEPPDARRRMWRIDARQKGRMPPPERPCGPDGASGGQAPSGYAAARDDASR